MISKGQQRLKSIKFILFCFIGLISVIGLLACGSVKTEENKSQDGNYNLQKTSLQIAGDSLSTIKLTFWEERDKLNLVQSTRGEPVSVDKKPLASVPKGIGRSTFQSSTIHQDQSPTIRQGSTLSSVDSYSKWYTASPSLEARAQRALEIYSRGGVPEGVLGDLSGQEITDSNGDVLAVMRDGYMTVRGTDGLDQGRVSFEPDGSARLSKDTSWDRMGDLEIVGSRLAEPPEGHPDELLGATTPIAYFGSIRSSTTLMPTQLAPSEFATELSIAPGTAAGLRQQGINVRSNMSFPSMQADTAITSERASGSGNTIDLVEAMEDDEFSSSHQACAQTTAYFITPKVIIFKEPNMSSCKNKVAGIKGEIEQSQKSFWLYKRNDIDILRTIIQQDTNGETISVVAMPSIVETSQLFGDIKLLKLTDVDGNNIIINNENLLTTNWEAIKF